LFDVGGAIKSDLSRMSPQELQEYIAESSSPTAKRMAQQLLAEKIAIARMQQNPGVTQLPSNLPVEEPVGAAGGGIIAFADEGEVKDKEIAEREATSTDTTSSASGVDTLVAQPPTRLPTVGATTAAANPATSVYGGIPMMSPEAREDFSQYSKMYKDLRSDTPKAREEAKWMAIMQAGLGIAGGTSPNALANISQGAMPAMAQYQAAMKDIRKDDREALKGLVDLGLKKEEFIQRAEKMGIDKYTADKVFEAHKYSADMTLKAAQVRAAAEKAPKSISGGDIDSAQIKNGADKIMRANPNMARGDAEYQAYMEILATRNPPQSNTAGIASLASGEQGAADKAMEPFRGTLKGLLYSGNEKKIADVTRQMYEAGEAARKAYIKSTGTNWSQSNRPPANAPATGGNPATTFITNPQAAARPAAPAAAAPPPPKIPPGTTPNPDGTFNFAGNDRVPAGRYKMNPDGTITLVK
jgi:hypothetical protein